MSDKLKLCIIKMMIDDICTFEKWDDYGFILATCCAISSVINAKEEDEQNGDV